MKTIEATVIVPDDRQMTLRLPDEIPPGEHRLVVLIEEPPPVVDAETTPTRWEEGLLVYDGELAAPIQPLIDDVREEQNQAITH